MKKHLILTSIFAIIATSATNNAMAISSDDINAINDSINMVQSDGNYTTTKGDFNAGTTNYSTEAGYGLYTYDHDNNPETPEIALTTNNGTETLDNTVFTYTDNTGATTNLGDNATGFTTSNFTGAAGTIDAADGKTDLTTLEANTTTVGLGNYQYMANFDNTVDALTALTADAPELSSFHNDITLTTGAITVNGNNEVNKPSINDYGFTVTLHDGSEGDFDLVYDASTNRYSYNYNGDVALDATDYPNINSQVSSKSADLIADTTLFNNAVATNTTNYNNAVDHYNTVHGVYESDTNTQSTLNTNYGNYETSFAEARANQTAAAEKLSEAQGAYAADLAIYTPVATAYNNYENSLGKSIDAKDETVLTKANAYADGLASNYDAAGTSAAETTRAQGEEAAIRGEFAAADETVLANAQAYADDLASNYDAAGTSAAETTRAQGEEAAIRSEFAAADTTLQNNINAETSRAQGEETAIRSEFAAADARLQQTIESEAATRVEADNALRKDIAASNTAILAGANAYTDEKVATLDKNISGGVAAATALSAVEVSNVKKGEVSVGGGYGYYNSQSAMAFGAAMGLTDRWSVNAGAGIASGDKTQVSFRAGTNYKFKLF